ncbi:MAG TPA: (d)CMP kinase [Blastocatellia bacterium]|nr:(d)CMP kinase [Blastocatellia bacterium]
MTHVIAIDGPSGSGKSTLGKALARRLGYIHIDSGAVYRAVGCAAMDAGVALEDKAAVAAVARRSAITQLGDPDHMKVVLDGRDVTDRIRRPDASHAASVVATYAEVRQAVVEKLRMMSESGPGVVMDGRDIGTKVFPNADVKLFLKASVETRAQRRWEEEKGRGRDVTLDQVKIELETRDRRDTERAATPLVQAIDAIEIDTSGLTGQGVAERALEIIGKQR